MQIAWKLTCSLNKCKGTIDNHKVNVKDKCSEPVMKRCGTISGPLPQSLESQNKSQVHKQIVKWHTYTNTRTENGHWKLKARATLPTWGSPFSYINERERVEEKHRGDVKCLDIKSKQQKLQTSHIASKNDWRSTAAMTHWKHSIYLRLSLWSTKNMENNYCNVHLIISKCVLTHDSEGPSISRSSLVISLKSWLLYYQWLLGCVMGSEGDWLQFKGWLL